MASATQADAFKRDGFHIARRLFEAEEMDLLLKISKADQELARKAGDVKDAKGGNSRLTLWNDPGENIYSAFVRCHRIVNTMEQFLDGEVYHYHRAGHPNYSYLEKWPDSRIKVLGRKQWEGMQATARA